MADELERRKARTSNLRGMTGARRDSRRGSAKENAESGCPGRARDGSPRGGSGIVGGTRMGRCAERNVTLRPDLMAREGARVALIDAVPEWAEQTRRMIEAEGGQSMVVPCDVTDPAACEAAVAASSGPGRAPAARRPARRP